MEILKKNHVYIILCDKNSKPQILEERSELHSLHVDLEATDQS